MKTGISIMAGLSLLALVSSANAQEPIRLSELQMDEVTAGYTATAIASAVGAAASNLSSATTVVTNTDVNSISPPHALSSAASAAAAVSFWTPGLPLANAAATARVQTTAAIAP